MCSSGGPRHNAGPSRCGHLSASAMPRRGPCCRLHALATGPLWQTWNRAVSRFEAVAGSPQHVSQAHRQLDVISSGRGSSHQV